MSRKKRSQDYSRCTRREFLKRAGAATAALSTMGVPAVLASRPKVSKAIVLGIDALDPRLVTKFVRLGLMPNCQRLMEQGSFSPLGTSDPPQSPVAWSNFISGTNPGGHGIFDFIARDPATLTPYFSTSRTSPPEWTAKFGRWSLPLAAGKSENLRGGPTFWDDLEREGIDCTIFRMPANFPPTRTQATTLSGLGTPDLQGSYGIFSYFTSDRDFPGLDGETHKEVRGGFLSHVELMDGTAKCTLRGPVNTCATDGRRVNIPFTVFVDPPQGMAKVAIQGDEFILREGEWSAWKTIKFTMLPYFASVSGICRFYLKQIRDGLGLYVSPVNIDPSDPALPISTPASYSRRLAHELGPYYTQGMPEDTAALSTGVFDDDAFRGQATLVLEESLRQFDHVLGQFRRGLLFHYFSSIDLNSHAFWRLFDQDHPLHSAEATEKHGDFLPWLYSQMDQVIGKALGCVDEKTLLLVVSDHGFTSFRRRVHLNSWLLDNGYVALRDPFMEGEGDLFKDAKWGETRAYGLGINGLYLNLKGREPDGSVRPGDEAEGLKAELTERLRSLEDPKTGERVVASVHRREEVYSGPHVDMAPDLIVGYNKHYRSSKESILGGFPERIIEDNRDPWSGDHCMDKQFLPGVCLCNRELTTDQPTLIDMAPTLLSTFGVPAPRGMTGKNVLEV